MSSRVTLFLAGLLLLGAIIAGYAGWSLSHQELPPPVAAAPTQTAVQSAMTQAEDKLRRPVVVAVHDLQPQVAITAQDVDIELLKLAPEGSFSKMEDVLGRKPQRVLPQGIWLAEANFGAGGPLARMIHSGERALAVSADDVTGAGGHISPGDYVDVLLFLPMDVDNAQKTAQIAVPALRVLSVDDELGADTSGQVVERSTRREEQGRLDQRLGGNAHNVVLAVPEALMTRLMLAVQVGSLRLAVRSAEENRLSHYWAGGTADTSLIDDTNRGLFKFQQVALEGPQRNAAPATVVAPAIQPVSTRAHGVEVIRGSGVVGAAAAPAPVNPYMQQQLQQTP